MKKIVINIVVIFLIIFIFDFLVFYLEARKYANYSGIKGLTDIYFDFYKRNPSQEFLYKEYILGEGNLYRDVVNKDSPKKPILLFGCSFVYGHQIPKESYFSEVLGKYTGRPVYNRAHHGFGVQHMLYQLENDDFYKVIPEPEYIIYTYLDEHISRMYVPVVFSIGEYNDIFYERKNNTVEFKKNNIFKRGSLFIIKLKTMSYGSRFFDKYKKENRDDFLKLHLLKAKKCVDAHWPNSKFIILNYYDQFNTIEIIRPELEKAGFIIINRNDLVPFDIKDTRYSISETNNHPNEHAWGYIVPKLMKEISKY